MSNQSVRKTLEQFISQCKEKHGDTYDYSDSVYLGSYKKIGIKCRTHGEFWQWPNDHRKGMGCAFCSGNRVDPAMFIKDMQVKFPDLDFSKFVYTGAKVKSVVVCKKHGEFLSRPNDLKFDHGCSKCGIDRQQESKIIKGTIRDPADIPEYENYRRHVWRTSNQQYKLHKYIINPTGLSRSLAYHLDHKYSIQQGWQNKIPAEVIGGYKNLQILEGKKNRQKGNKCNITLESLQILS